MFLNRGIDMIRPKWEYCECGCKGYACGDLWCYDDLKGISVLFNGHAFRGKKLGEFTYAEGDKLDQLAVEFIQEEIRKLAKLLKDV